MIGELRGFRNPSTQHDGGESQRDRQQIRHAPTPIDHGVRAGDIRGDHRDDGDGRRAERRAEIRAHVEPGAVVAALLIRRELGDVGGRAGVFTAGREALHHFERIERRHRPCADLRGRRQHADQRGGNRHEPHREEQHLLPADPVAERPEDYAAHGPHQEADGESQQHHQQPQILRQAFRKHAGHRHGQVAVDAEIVPFHEIADYGSADRLLQRAALHDRDIAGSQPVPAQVDPAHARRLCCAPDSRATRF